MLPARDSQAGSPIFKERRKPVWNQNKPHRPSSLRRISSASLPRSQRVTSLVDLLPPSEKDEEKEVETQSHPAKVEDHNDMNSTRRDALSTRSTNSSSSHATTSEQTASGLGINLNTTTPRLEKVDEWLENEQNNDKKEAKSPSQSIMSISKVRGPRQEPVRRVPSSPHVAVGGHLEMMPSPLALPARPPTTPGGGKRAYPEPEAKPEDVGKRPEQFIDELLEGLYRGQAGSLSRSKSQIMMLEENSKTNNSQGPVLPPVPVSTPTRRRRPSHRIPSSPLTRNQQTIIIQPPAEQTTTVGFAPSPVRPDPSRPSLLQTTSRRPRFESPSETTLASYFEPTDYKSFPILPSRQGPPPVEPAPYAYAHRIYSKPETVDPVVVRFQHQRGNSVLRPLLYFFDDERESIRQSVHAKTITCKSHASCVECVEREYAYLEIKIMPTTMTPEERATVLAGNRSLRTIKTELENLLENGLISDDVYNAITEQLPSEGSFKSNVNANANRSTESSTPVSSFQALSVNEPPPAYNSPNGPPPPPARQNSAPSRPELSRAVALYPYSEPDDCTFVVGDEIAVFEHMNKDWWMGRNLRTGKEGVFPVNYVTVKAGGPSPGPYMNEKAQPYGYAGQQQQQQQQQPYQGYQQSQGPPPPGPSNPYNSDAPPQAVANEPSKGQEMGKKFGKKLGNAAIFGAGATIGSNIVNSIF